MKVFVCAGMGLAKNENINRQAVELGKMLAENQALYVQGGSDEGLMVLDYILRELFNLLEE